MISNNELICFTLLFCFAAYVRFTNTIREKTKIAEKDVLDAQQQQHFTRRELTHQYSNCSSLPSLTSDDFSDDETSPYDATYCISSDMPFSIPGKPINEKDENQHMNHFLNLNSKDPLQKPCYSAIQRKTMDIR